MPSQIGKTPEEMNTYCAEHGFAGWFETSAKDNKNIEEAAKFLVEKILENHIEQQKEDENTIKIDNKPQPDKGQGTQSSGGCCGGK